MTFEETTPEGHALLRPVYKVDVLPPGATLAPTGLPTFDRLGVAHKVTVGYRGTRDLIFEVGNVFMEQLHAHEQHVTPASLRPDLHRTGPAPAVDAPARAGH